MQHWGTVASSQSSDPCCSNIHADSSLVSHPPALEAASCASLHTKQPTHLQVCQHRQLGLQKPLAQRQRGALGVGVDLPNPGRHLLSRLDMGREAVEARLADVHHWHQSSAPPQANAQSAMPTHNCVQAQSLSRMQVGSSVQTPLYISDNAACSHIAACSHMAACWVAVQAHAGWPQHAGPSRPPLKDAPTPNLHLMPPQQVAMPSDWCTHLVPGPNLSSRP